MNIFNIIIIIVLSILVVINIILLIKSLKPKNETMDLLERLGKFELSINREIISLKEKMNTDITNNFININEKI